MIWLGVDFESTGLSTSEDRILEVGAVLWSVERKQPLAIYSALTHFKELTGLPDIITKLTGITEKDLEEYGIPIEGALDDLGRLADGVDYIVAHNGTGFDKPIYEAECERYNGTPIDKPWIDTLTDVPYPDTMKSKALNSLAYDHEFINPFPHRAVTDVLTMLKIASKYDPVQIIDYRNSKSIEIRAVVSFDNKDKAKARGYHWDGPRKWWIKFIKEFQLEEEIEASDFKVTVIS